MRKHRGILLLLVTMVLTIFFPFTAIDINAAGTVTGPDGNQYQISDKGASLDKWNPDNKGAITIPDSIIYNGNTYNVWKICNAAFYDPTAPDAYSGVSSVTIGKNVQIIESRAFDSCKGLKSVSFKSGSALKTIENDAFAECTELTTVQLPSGLQTIGSSCFVGCSKLNSINIPDSVTEIGFSAFLQCSNLTSITLPSSLTTLGSNITGVFEQCTSLKTVDMSRCTRLTEIPHDTFKNCSSLTSASFPEGLTTISDNAFYGCIVLNDFTLPRTIQTIGTAAFGGCSSLKKVTILAMTAPSIVYDRARPVNNSLATSISFTVPAGATGYDTGSWSAYKRKITYSDALVPPTPSPTNTNTPVPTEKPTVSPTQKPTVSPTKKPTVSPTQKPTVSPTQKPTVSPTQKPTVSPTQKPTVSPTQKPTVSPTKKPTVSPTQKPTVSPTQKPTVSPTQKPTVSPTQKPTVSPTKKPTVSPTQKPTISPTKKPTVSPTQKPTVSPTQKPTVSPTQKPTVSPTQKPTVSPTQKPTVSPTKKPTVSPTQKPTVSPTKKPTVSPTQKPTVSPTKKPTATATATPSPTRRPSATATPSPTRRPTATATPRPTRRPRATNTPTPTMEITATPTATATPSPTAIVQGASRPSQTDAQAPGVADFVERLYTVALGRASDPYGKSDWVNRVKVEGYTGADLARGFLFSNEFLGKNMSDSAFLDTLYMTFFNRAADSQKSNWLNLMSSGWTKKQVIDGFINSTEWANLCLTYGIASGSSALPNIEIEPSAEVIEFARRLYTTCLGRPADASGLDHWARDIANMRVSGSAAAHGFFFSGEFVNAGYSDAEFVARLYRTFMGREYDQAGFDAWMNALASGQTREQVFQGFASSAEFTAICAEYGILK